MPPLHPPTLSLDGGHDPIHCSVHGSKCYGPILSAMVALPAILVASLCDRPQGPFRHVSYSWEHAMCAPGLAHPRRRLGGCLFGPSRTASSLRPHAARPAPGATRPSRADVRSRRRQAIKGPVGHTKCCLSGCLQLDLSTQVSAPWVAAETGLPRTTSPLAFRRRPSSAASPASTPTQSDR